MLKNDNVKQAYSLSSEKKQHALNLYKKAVVEMLTKYCEFFPAHRIVYLIHNYYYISLLPLKRIPCLLAAPIPPK